MRTEDEMKVLDKVEEKLNELSMTDDEIIAENDRQLAAMSRGIAANADLPEGLREMPLAPL